MLKKVLVIDDSALIHQMYKMVLMRYKCDIVDALNGQDGLDKLAKNPDTNMILLDINMPLMNGLEFIKKVKGLGTYRPYSDHHCEHRGERGRHHARSFPGSKGICEKTLSTKRSPYADREALPLK